MLLPAGALDALLLGEGGSRSNVAEMLEPALGSLCIELVRAGVLQRVLQFGGRIAAIVDPISPRYEPRPVNLPAPDAPMRLSRFACIRAENGTLTIEGPLSHSRIRLLDAGLASALAIFAAPYAPADLYRRLRVPDGRMLELFVALLAAEGLAGRVDSGGESEELSHWEFHDLYFHARSRQGRHNNPVGATYRFRGQVAPAPAVKPPMSTVRIPLFRPDLHWLAAHDLPLTAAIERRRSIRTSTSNGILSEQLGEFLFRVARVKELARFDDVELTCRPYPNGGASYELELYVLAERCQGLLRGLYHYDPMTHSLEPICPPTSATAAFIQDARTATAGLAHPSILLLVAARFRRVSWKYQSIAYATILKNVGALFQTMYLVATAMGLGPCALGAGNSDRFTDMIGSDYFGETTVGEFMLSNPV